jgi:hypothetical protein
MDTVSIANIKAELNTLQKEELIGLCLRLARFKKENKELLAYLLFNQYQKQAFVADVSAVIAADLLSANATSPYLAKKTIRKVLRQISKYCRYAGDSEVEVQLLLQFCSSFLQLPSVIRRHYALEKLYATQLKKLTGSIAALHEDLQYDYLRQMDKLS